LTPRAALDTVASSVESTAEANMNARAERLNYIAKELQIIRHDLAQLAGSDQVAEVRMEGVVLR
jgi:hypothetical protein